MGTSIQKDNGCRGEDSSDEERLLPEGPTTARKITLPKVQLIVLLIAYFPQPVASTVIYPFIAKASAHSFHAVTFSDSGYTVSQLVEELDLINGDVSKIGYYAGLFVG